MDQAWKPFRDPAPGTRNSPGRRRIRCWRRWPDPAAAGVVEAACELQEHHHPYAHLSADHVTIAPTGAGSLLFTGLIGWMQLLLFLLPAALLLAYYFVAAARMDGFSKRCCGC